MTIRAKLILSFALLVVITLVIYLASMISMSGMNERINRIGSSTAVKIRLGGRINSDILYISRAEKNMILTRSTSEIQSIAQEVTQRRQSLKNRLTEMRELVDENGKQQIDQFQKKWDQYNAQFEEVKMLALLNSNEKAKNILLAEGEESFQMSSNLLEEIMSNTSGVALTTASELYGTLNRISNNQHKLLAVVEDEKLNTLEDQNKQMEQDMEILRTTLKSRLGGSNSAIFDKMELHLSQFIAANKDIREYGTANTNNKALEISQGKGRTFNDEATALMAGLVNKNDTQLEVDQQESDQNFDRANILMLALIIIGVVLAIIIAYWIITSIMKSLKSANRAISSMSAGDFTQDIDVASKDEIGEMLRLLVKMRNRLSDIVGSVKRASDNIAAASQQVSSGSQQMAEGAQEQSSSAEQASSSMEEMAANIEQSKDNSQQTEKISRKATGDIQESSESVQSTVEAINQITQKISIIGEIASKTDLLALNAAVEAARAGEHGKGFAVVASEVRKLAERSQEAASEIDEISARTVSKAEKSGKQLTEVVPDIDKTAELIQEISASLVEQSTGSEQINTAIQQLSQVIQQNASASEEMASSSEELAAQAEELNDTMSFFKIEDNDLVKKSSKAKHNRAAKSLKKDFAKKEKQPNKADNDDYDISLEGLDNGNLKDDDFEQY